MIQLSSFIDNKLNSFASPVISYLQLMRLAEEKYPPHTSTGLRRTSFMNLQIIFNPR